MKQVKQHKDGDSLRGRLMCYRCYYSFPAPTEARYASMVKCPNCKSRDPRYAHKCDENDPLKHSAGWPYDDPTVKCDC